MKRGGSRALQGTDFLFYFFGWPEVQIEVQRDKLYAQQKKEQKQEFAGH